MHLQALEGGSDRLDALIARLQQDTRHAHVDVVSRRNIDARLFGDWSMAAVQTSPAIVQTLEAAGDHDALRRFLPQARAAAGYLALLTPACERAEAALQRS